MPCSLFAENPQAQKCCQKWINSKSVVSDTENQDRWDRNRWDRMSEFRCPSQQLSRFRQLPSTSPLVGCPATAPQSTATKKPAIYSFQWSSNRHATCREVLRPGPSIKRYHVRIYVQCGFSN